MGIDIIAFIVGVLLGIFLYWRESNGNGAYRFINKILNSKELQMSASNPKGFVFKQAFIPRLIFVILLTLVLTLIVQFLTPLNIFSSVDGVSAYASFATGTLIGTYVANFVIKTTEVVEEKSDSIGEIVEGAVEKGKDFIDDLKKKEIETIETPKAEIEKESAPEIEKKSARDRLKDKGLM
jgi:hypothetical protein